MPTVSFSDVMHKIEKLDPEWVEYGGAIDMWEKDRLSKIKLGRSIIRLIGLKSTPDGQFKFHLQCEYYNPEDTNALYYSTKIDTQIITPDKQTIKIAALTYHSQSHDECLELYSYIKPFVEKIMQKREQKEKDKNKKQQDFESRLLDKYL